jgi:hypothetical protein
VNGALPLTNTQIERMLALFTTNIRNEIAQQVSALRDSPSGSEATQASSVQSGDLYFGSNPYSEDDRYQLWTWGGRLHPVPPEFRFEAMSCKSLWDLWHYGDRNRRIRPFKLLKKYDLKKKVTVVDPVTNTNVEEWCGDEFRFAKARKVMELVQKFADVPGFNNTAVVSEMSRINGARVFESGYSTLINKINNLRNADGNRHSDRRDGELSYTTLYNDIMKYKLVA